MLVVISPAKRLDWAERDIEVTQPDFQDDAIRLSKTARNLTLGDLKKKGYWIVEEGCALLRFEVFRVVDVEAKFGSRPYSVKEWEDAGNHLANERGACGGTWQDKHLEVESVTKWDGSQDHRCVCEMVPRPNIGESSHPVLGSPEDGVLVISVNKVAGKKAAGKIPRSASKKIKAKKYGRR